MNKNRLLDVEYIQEILDEGYHYTEETRGRDLVLVIGNTGVGKSTTCNYLLGYRMKEGTYNGRPIIETVDETNIKIGHEVKSETLYAKSFVIEGYSELSNEERKNPICLLDCPGFFDNRTIEDKVIESISTELAIRCARQVKGILILISLNILMETKVKELRELVKTLICLFKDPVEMVQYSIFIITKKYKYMPHDQAMQITIGALSSLKDYCENQASRLRENPNLRSSEELTCIDYDHIATYFSAVLKRGDIILIDPLDNGVSRKEIMKRINGIKPRKGYVKKFAEAGASAVKKAVGMESEASTRPITINDFSFSEGNEDRVKFNKALYDRAREGINFIAEVQRCSETNRKLYSEILNCNTRLSSLEKLQCNLEKEICKTDEDKSQLSKIDFESIKTFESMIIENDKQIESKEKELNDDDKKIKELNKNLEKIDVDMPKLFIEKSMKKNVSWWKFFGWEEMNFEAETDNEAISIIKVEKEMKNGYWKNEVDEREKGIYKIKYESKYLARPAEASVKTYIKTKDANGNKISIEKMKCNLSDLTKRQDRLKLEIEKLKSENQALRATVAQAKINKEDYKKSLKQKLEEYKKEIQCLNAQVVKKQENRRKAKQSGMTYLQEFIGNRHKYDIIISIAELLELSSVLIKHFIFQYNEFLSCKDSYISSFDESISDSLPYNYERESEEERIFALKDPITGEEIKDLVVTSAGTAFDEHSLLIQFDTNLENPLPFIFSREDGSTEEIEFLSWQKVPDIQNYIDRLRNDKLIHSQSSSSIMPPAAFVGDEINKLSLDQLVQQEDNLFKEIERMRNEIEIKETDLEKVARHRARLQLERQTEETETEETVPVLED